MRNRFTAVLAGMGCLLALAWAADAAEDAAKVPSSGKIKVVILVGGHGYDKAGFDKLWAGYDDIAAEVWQGAPYTVFDDVSKFPYDVIVFYNLSSGITETQKQNFLKLLEKGVGVVVWHHALANCPDWPEFEKIAGARFWLKDGERDGAKVPASGTGGGRVNVHVEDPNHPITKDVNDFEVQDETYNRQTFAEGIRVLLTTDHARSDKNLAWVKNYAKSRVFGYQSGHDAKTWTSEGFQKVFGRGIRWAAGRLP